MLLLISEVPSFMAQLEALRTPVGISTNSSVQMYSDVTELKPRGMAHSVHLCLLLRLVLSGFSGGNAKAVIVVSFLCKFSPDSLELQCYIMRIHVHAYIYI